MIWICSDYYSFIPFFIAGLIYISGGIVCVVASIMQIVHYYRLNHFAAHHQKVLSSFGDNNVEMQKTISDDTFHDSETISYKNMDQETISVWMLFILLYFPSLFFCKNIIFNLILLKLTLLQ